MTQIHEFPDNFYLPGSNPIPLLESLGFLLQFARRPIFFMEKLYQEYGNIVTAARGTQHTIFAFGPTYNRQILKNPKQFYSYDLRTTPLRFAEGSELMKLNTGLSLVNGTQHKRIRHLMLPFFHQASIRLW